MELSIKKKDVIRLKDNTTNSIVISVEHLDIVLPVTKFDKAMDAKYLLDNIGGCNHRLFDGGHTVLGAWKKTAEASENFIEHINGWLSGLFKDLITPKGLPFITITPEQYYELCELTEKIGMTKSATYSLLSYTPIELFGVVATVPCIASKAKVETISTHTSVATMLSLIAVRTHSIPAGILATIQIIKVAKIAKNHKETRIEVIKSVLIATTSLMLTFMNPTLGILFAGITLIPSSFYSRTWKKIKRVFKKKRRRYG